MNRGNGIMVGMLAIAISIQLAMAFAMKDYAFRVSDYIQINAVALQKVLVQTKDEQATLNDVRAELHDLDVCKASISKALPMGKFEGEQQ